MKKASIVVLKIISGVIGLAAFTFVSAWFSVSILEPPYDYILTSGIVLTPIILLIWYLYHKLNLLELEEQKMKVVKEKILK